MNFPSWAGAKASAVFLMLGEEQAMKLQDPSLFRQAALVGDNWIEADTNNAIEVNNPATGE
ncbi:hypothetical protein ACC743_38995, partial [Rhizobium ruizarguesonis]